MLRMAVGHSDAFDPEEAFAAALEQCRPQLAGAQPAAAIIFAAFESFQPAMVQVLRAEFPDIQILGSTSAAEMSSSAGYQEDSVTLALLVADSVDFTTGMASIEVDLEGAARAAAERALGATSKRPRLCLMLADGLSGQRALEAVRAALPDDVVVVGGGSSGRTVGTRPSFQFSNEAVVENGLALLLLSGEFAFSVAVGTGLRPIGPVGTVTRSGEGVIDEIDGRPAAEFIADYVDAAGPATYGNPLAVRSVGSAEPYLRVMLRQDAATGALSVPGSVPVGSTVQITTASTDEIVRASGDTVRRAAEAFPAGATPAAALLFSCAVRRFLLGSRTAQEVIEARALLPGDLPLVGMYCGGEIAPVDDGNVSRFLNETFVAVLLGS
ncbi:MAG TPA: FIST N-terminal domain-containing protein [Candidatus Limnocylindrales bacterium]